ncbi:hypothetical protein INT47_008282 [Mucor saturninus]|uniref:Uncharacterized protein n=1 Tax=Mucor saturninus TaxID=64648 RepID=A0A8H7RFB2_9FUNG|nr:hypothetical protein INT47_008282 [Mucor saturninus]
MSNHKVPVINVKLIFNHHNDPILIIQNDDSDSASDYEDNDTLQSYYEVSSKDEVDLIHLQEHQDASLRWQRYAYENQQAKSYR